MTGLSGPLAGIGSNWMPHFQLDAARVGTMARPPYLDAAWKAQPKNAWPKAEER